MSEQNKSECCKARMVNEGKQCENCGSDGKVTKQVVAYLAIQFQEGTIQKAKAFAEEWKDKNGEEVVLVYRGKKISYEMADFLELVGFEVPCETCNDEGKVEVQTKEDQVDEKVCPDCKL